jgi:DNA-binding beta-propeller fold protein YncE
VKAIRDTDIEPSTISCKNDMIYVSEKAYNQIHVYDNNLKLKRLISMSGVVVSMHTSLVVDKKVNVFIDGNSALGLFNINPTSRDRRFSDLLRHSRGQDQQPVCHFYEHMDCLEDVAVSQVNTKDTTIYSADSCSNEISYFNLSENKTDRLVQKLRLKLPHSPKSIVSNTDGTLFAITSEPSKIYIINTDRCSQN